MYIGGREKAKEGAASNSVGLARLVADYADSADLLRAVRVFRVSIGSALRLTTSGTQNQNPNH